MTSNASTDSLPDGSTLSADAARETPLNAGMYMFNMCVVGVWHITTIYAEHTSDEVATFYQKVSISTTRRLPAKNVSEGAGTCVD